jgi:hypothetical protein
MSACVGVYFDIVIPVHGYEQDEQNLQLNTYPTEQRNDDYYKYNN